MDVAIQDCKRHDSSVGGTTEEGKPLRADTEDSRKAKAKEIIKRLREVFKEIPEEEFIALYASKYGPLEALVATILSQNTTERNAFEAYFNLKKRLRGRITREELERISLEELKEAIRKAGLVNSKSKAIKEVATINLEEVLRMETEEARKKLMEIKGVGAKTADVVLALYGHKTFPIDTHVRRVVERLGLAKGSYEEMREELLKLFDQPLLAHHLLILLGRRVCKKRNPQCDRCPLKDLCHFAKGGTTTALTGPSGPGT